MAAAAAADEPTAKMVKQEQQENYNTKTYREEYKRFKKDNVFYFPPKTIDGVEVITKVQIQAEEDLVYKDLVIKQDMVVLTMLATKECRNGFMFHKQSNMSYKMFQKIFTYMAGEGGDAYYKNIFKNVMAFMAKEVPEMRLYGNKLMTGTAHNIITRQEGNFFDTLPVVFRCGQCGDMTDGKVMIVGEGEDHSMVKPSKHRCVKCYFYNSSPDFDTDVANYMLDYDHDKFEFDRLGSRKFCERYEGGLIHEDMYNYEDEEIDHHRGWSDIWIDKMMNK